MVSVPAQFLAIFLPYNGAAGWCKYWFSGTIFWTQIIFKVAPIFASCVSFASLSNPFSKSGQHLQTKYAKKVISKK